MVSEGVKDELPEECSDTTEEDTEQSTEEDTEELILNSRPTEEPFWMKQLED